MSLVQSSKTLPPAPPPLAYHEPFLGNQGLDGFHHADVEECRKERKVDVLLRLERRHVLFVLAGGIGVFVVVTGSPARPEACEAHAGDNILMRARRRI